MSSQQSFWKLSLTNGESLPMELPANVAADEIKSGSYSTNSVNLVTQDGRIFSTKYVKGKSSTDWKWPLVSSQLEHSTIIEVESGTGHHVALTSNHTVITWGKNSQDQMKGICTKNAKQEKGNTCGSPYFNPRIVRQLLNIKVVQIACGDAHTLCLSEEGYVYSWGANGSYQLGSDRQSPGRVKNLENIHIIHISAGGKHSVALTASKHIYCWGSNSSGQLGLKSDIKMQPFPVECNTLPPNITVKTISCGDTHTAFLTTDGCVFVCGSTTSQSCEKEHNDDFCPTKISELSETNVSQIICGRNCTLAWAQATNELYTLGSAQKTISLPDEVENPTFFCGKDYIYAFSSQIDASQTMNTQEQLTLDSVQDAMRNKTVEETKKMVEKAFSNASCINGSFISKSHCSKHSHNVDLDAAKTFFQELNESELRSIAVKAVQKLLENLEVNSCVGMESVRLHLILSCWLCTENIQMLDHYFISYLGKSLIQFKDQDKKVEEWIKTTPVEFFKRLVLVFKTCAVGAWEKLSSFQNDNKQTPKNSPDSNIRKVVDKMKKPHVTQQEKENIVAFGIFFERDSMIKQGKDTRFFHMHNDSMSSPEKAIIKSCVETLNTLHKINLLREKQILAEEFYINELTDMINIKLDFLQSYPDTKFRFCNYNFLYNPASKLFLLISQCELKQHYSPQFAYWEIPAIRTVLQVTRNNLADEAIALLSLDEIEIRRRLEIVYKDELHYTSNAMIQEFFHLLLEKLHEPSFGVFHFDEDSKSYLFREKAELHRINFIGLVCGLALYNGATLNLQYPPVMYKKLLNKPIWLEDLFDLDSSLKTILDYDKDDIEDIFCLDFSGLCENGSDIPVTQNNKKLYVEQKLELILNTSINKEFESFRKGFSIGFPTELLNGFTPNELKHILVGAEECDLKLLEKITQYPNDYGYVECYTRDDPTIKFFWDVVHSMDATSQKALLRFLFGTDHIPVYGVSRMTLNIIPREEPDFHCNALLPKIRTCDTTLMLPRYTKRHFLERNLSFAVNSKSGFGPLYDNNNCDNDEE